MKKNKKRKTKITLLSLFLAFTLCLSCFTPAIAGEVQEEPGETFEQISEEAAMSDTTLHEEEVFDAMTEGLVAAPQTPAVTPAAPPEDAPAELSVVPTENEYVAEIENTAPAASPTEGFVCVSNSWKWYENGAVASKSGLVYGTINGVNNWYYIRNGVFTSITAVVPKANAGDNNLYYVSNGAYSAATSGLFAHKYDNGYSGEYYVENGVVPALTGLVYGNHFGTYNWYYVENGQIQSKTGIAQKAKKEDNDKYFVKGGAFFAETGLAQMIGAPENSDWYYVKDGKCTSATTFTKKLHGNDKYSYYYVNGSTILNATGLIKGTIDGTTAWYFIQNGKYTMAYGISRKVDTSTDTDWYYVSQGKYTKSTGLAPRADGSNNTLYYVKGGKYTKSTVVATKIVGGGKYYAKSGKVVPGTEGWVTVNGVYYYVNKDQSLYTGWKKYSGNWYYLTENGTLYSTWKKIDGTYYYFNYNGVCTATGVNYSYMGTFSIPSIGVSVALYFAVPGSAAAQNAVDSASGGAYMPYRDDMVIYADHRGEGFKNLVSARVGTIGYFTCPDGSVYKLKCVQISNATQGNNGYVDGYGVSYKNWDCDVAAITCNPHFPQTFVSKWKWQ